MSRADHLIWIDLEMTGLDPDRDRIIEIATLITDADLNVVAEGPVMAIHQSDEVLAAMDEWNQHHHGVSGLIDRVRTSGVDEQDAERITLDFLGRYIEPRRSPMCGNSICQDRRFMAREMPTLEAFFHYRNLDVSTLKILAGLWAPAALEGVVKNTEHLALADIHESIAELRHYRAQLLKLPTAAG